MVLESLIPMLKNERICWFSDDQNVVRIMEICSKKPELWEEAFAIFSIAALSLIRIEPQWIPHAENQQADCLSCLKIQTIGRFSHGFSLSWTGYGDLIPLID